MIQQLKASLVMLALLTVLTGVLYPLFVTAVGQIAFPYQAQGSLLTDDENVIGSVLIGQAMGNDAYFWPRPSATNYGTLPSGASNAGLTSDALAEAVQARSAFLREAHNQPAGAPVPPDLIFASGSGLDPHISPEATRFQIDRVAMARGFSEEQRQALSRLVDDSIEPPQFGIYGRPRVNVLLLNRALDELSQRTD